MAIRETYLIAGIRVYEPSEGPDPLCGFGTLQGDLDTIEFDDGCTTSLRDDYPDGDIAVLCTTCGPEDPPCFLPEYRLGAYSEPEVDPEVEADCDCDFCKYDNDDPFDVRDLLPRAFVEGDTVVIVARTRGDAGFIGLKAEVMSGVVVDGEIKLAPLSVRPDTGGTEWFYWDVDQLELVETYEQSIEVDPPAFVQGQRVLGPAPKGFGWIDRECSFVANCYAVTYEETGETDHEDADDLDLAWSQTPQGYAAIDVAEVDPPRVYPTPRLNTPYPVLEDWEKELLAESDEPVELDPVVTLRNLAGELFDKADELVSAAEAALNLADALEIIVSEQG